MNATGFLLAGRQGEAVQCGARVWSFAEVSREAARFAHVLRNLGVHRRDRVWIWAEPSERHLFLSLGTIGFGACVGTLPALADPARVRAALEATGARMLCTHANRKPHVDPWRGELVEMWHVLLVDDAPARMSGGDFRLRDYAAGAPDSFAWAAVGPEAPALVGEDGSLRTHEFIRAAAGRPPLADCAWDDPRLVPEAVAPAWLAGRPAVVRAADGSAPPGP